MDFMRCPLCPHLFHNGVAELARHLSTQHLMTNSAWTLARILVSCTPLGQQQVFQVMGDVKNFQDSLRQKDLELMRRKKELDNIRSEMPDLTKENPKETRIKSSQTDHAEIQPIRIDNSCQTDTCLPACTEDSEIEELKLNIEEKKTRVIELNRELRNTLARIKSVKDGDMEVDFDCLQVSVNRGADEKISMLSILREELKAVKDTLLKKDEEIARWKVGVDDLNRKLKRELRIKSESSKKELKLVKGKDLEMKKMAQLVESQRLVHGKEIQDLNQKLQNQINKSQSLRNREKTLMEEIKLLEANICKKKETVQSLIKQTNMLAGEVEQMKSRPSTDMHDEKDFEIFRLHKKIATLDMKARDFEKNVDELNITLVKKCEENEAAELNFDKYKEQSEQMISEKENKILCLKKELETTKADVYTVVDEMERCTELKFKQEKALAAMDRKFERSKEITCLMKESLTGLAAMHGDTSEKLIEAVRNTAQASREVVYDVRQKFKDIEKEFEQVWQDQVDEIVVKKEPEENSKYSIRNETFIAQNLLDKFDTEFGEGKGYEKSAKVILSTSSNVAECGGSKKRWKRKFAE